MSTIRSFDEIGAWRSARELAKDIFDVSCKDSFAKDFGLKDQINRATGSIMDNIAEGFDRGGTREFLQFLSYALGSCSEVRSQLYRAFDRKHITAETFAMLSDKAININKAISAFMRYLRNTELRGFKFHKSST